MALEVYWGSGSPFAWRVLLALELKELSYESRLLSFSKGDTRTPEFLALNPRGKVPLLKDGDVVVRESQAILYYLDRKYPQPPLYGRTPEEAARVMVSISEQASYLEPPLNVITHFVLFGDPASEPDGLASSVEKIHGELDRIEAQLARTSWLAGDAVSAADLSLYPTLMLLLRAAGKEQAASLGLGLVPIATRYPSIGRWMKAIESHPGYDRTYPPHWRG